MMPTEVYDHSICTANGHLDPLKAQHFGFSKQVPLKIISLCPPGPATYFTQGYLVFESGRPQLPPGTFCSIILQAKRV